MEIKDLDSLRKSFPDVSITIPSDGCVRIVCGSRPVFSIDRVEKVVSEITTLNSHLKVVSTREGTNRHGQREATLVFKEK